MTKVEVGSILKCSGMTLRVTEIRGTWMKCDYLAADGTWKPRGRTESRKKIAEMILDGRAEVVQ